MPDWVRYGRTSDLVTLAVLVAVGLLMAALLGIVIVRIWRPTFLLPQARPPQSTRFVPHWQLMTMLAVFALMLFGALVSSVVRALSGR